MSGTPVSIHVEGVEDALRDLRLYEGIGWAIAPMEQATNLLKADMRVYPSRPLTYGTAFSPAAYSRRDGSTGTRMRRRVFYKRTGTLKKRWTTRIRRISTHSVLGVVGNNTSYAPWVQSREFQAGMHRGIWQTDASVMEARRAAIVAMFRRALESKRSWRSGFSILAGG